MVHAVCSSPGAELFLLPCESSQKNFFKISNEFIRALHFFIIFESTITFSLYDYDNVEKYKRPIRVGFSHLSEKHKCKAKLTPTQLF